MAEYSLKVTNKSGNATIFTIILKQGNVNSSIANLTVYPLAWDCRYATPNTTINFNWNDNYDVIWSQPGQRLAVGVICDVRPVEQVKKNPQRRSTKTPLLASQASGLESVGLNANNKVTLKYLKEYNAYDFLPLEPGGTDNITTTTDNSVPNANTTSPSVAAGIGIGMSSSGGFLVPAQPNISVTWSVEPLEYYLIYGNYKIGEILDNTIIMSSALLIPFEGVSKRSAILDNNNCLQLVD